MAEAARVDRAPQQTRENEGKELLVCVAENLKKRRGIFGYSQEHVARDLGVSVDSVRKWEQSAVMPRPETLVGLSKLYKIPISEFFRGAPGAQTKPRKRQKKK